MRRSFYHYMLTQRGPNHLDEVAVLANEIAEDIQFPKQSDDYHEISDYVEFVNYVPNMDIFDRAWERYLDHNS